MYKTYNKFNVSSPLERTVDNIVFHSKKEASEYIKLKLLTRNNEISCLKLQPKFLLQKGYDYRNTKIRPIYYFADFSFYENGNEKNVDSGDALKDLVVIDVKGMNTPVYKLKKKLLLKQYPQIDFREV